MSKLHRLRRRHARGRYVPLALVGLLSAGLLGVAGSASLAQPPADAGGQALPRFRRVFAPADQLQAWPFQNERYLPLPGAEFEDLVRRAEAATSDAGLPSGSEVQACRYTAKFDDVELTGAGEIDLRRRNGETRMVRLAPFGLAAFDARWREGDVPARFGVSAGGDALLLVDRDDTLRFSWKQRVVRESADVASLFVDFPHCPVVSLTLELPEAYDVQRGEYVLQRSATPKDGRYAWTLLAAGGRLRVRFARREAELDLRRNGVRIDSAYDFTERGVELTAQLRIDALHAPLETITLELDPGLTLVDARLPDRRITWFALPEAPAPAAPPAATKPPVPNPTPPKPTAAATKPAPQAAGTKPVSAATAAPTPKPASTAPAAVARPVAAAARPQRYVLEFERPLVGAGRTLFLKAVAPLVVGRRHRVPTLRAPDLFWQQATLTLSVPAPLEIVRLDPRESVFNNPVPLAGNRPGEAVEVQCFAPSASVDLLLVRRNRPVDASTVTLWNVREEEAAATFHGEFRIEVGHRFTLEADLPSRWIIDSVVSSPATALADWSLSDAADRRRTLSLRLAQPLAPDRPLRVTIVGRLKHHNAGDRLTREQMRFVEFRNTADPRPLYGLCAEEGLRLQLRDGEDSKAIVSAERLDPVRRELLGGFAADYLLSGADFWEVDVRRGLADFAAVVAVDARLTAPVETPAAAPSAWQLREDYRIRLSNAAGTPLEQVRVRIVPAKPTPLQWTLGGGRGGQITAVRLPATEGATTGPANAAAEEIWEITFRKPPPGEVELEGSRESPFTAQAPVSLASVVDASPQSGEVRVTAEAALPVRLINRTLAPLPAADDAEESGLRGLFRYQPGPASTSELAALEVAQVRGHEHSSPAALVWLLRYDSKYDAARRLVHRATLYAQSLQTGRCRLSVDEPAQLVAVRVNGVVQDAVQGREAELKLDSAGALMRVEVDFTTIDEASGRLRMLELPVVRLDVPVLLTVREVAVPTSFDVPADAGLRSLRTHEGGLNLRRLFGPLVSPDTTATLTLPAGIGGVVRTTGLRLPRAMRDVAEAARLHAALGAVVRERSNAAADSRRPLTWAEAWQAALQRQPAGVATSLRFDAQMLRAAGVSAESSVALKIRRADDDKAIGEQTLEASGLVLAVDGRGFVLTAGGAAYSDDDDTLRVFTPQALQASRGEAEPPCELSDWKSAPPGAWSMLPTSPSLFAGEPQGQDYVVPLEGDTWGVWIIRREIPPLLALAFVAAGFVLGRFLFMARRGLLPSAACTFAVMAAVLPDWVGVGAASLFLGLAAGVVVCVILPPRGRERSQRLGVGAVNEAERPSASTPSRAAPLSTWLVLAGLAASAHAQSPAATPPSEDALQPPAAMVFIPVDEKGKPSGDRYQVPERLLRSLQSRAGTDAVVDAPVLIQSARYTAHIARDVEQARYVVTELVATFDLFAMQGPARVTVPLGVGPWLPAGGAGTLTAMIDGRMVDVEATLGGQSIVLDVAEAGAARLELTLRPAAAVGAETSFSIAVPRVTDAELRVVAPPELTDLAVAGAAETLRWSMDRHEAQVRLAVADKLSLSWSAQSGVEAQAYSVDRLTWLRVRPGSMVLDLRLVVRPPAAGVKEILLTADPRLQWLPKRGEDSLIADVEQTPITNDQAVVGQRIRLELARPIVKEATVEVSFLLTGGAGVGNMRRPELRLADETPGLRLFAYSVDPLLESSVSLGQGLQPLAVPEFLKAWGSETLLPQAAYTLTATTNTWTLSARPKRAVFDARQTQVVVCGARRLDIALEAEIDVTEGLVYHHELQTPPEMTIDSVDVAEVGDDSGGRVGRWSRDEQGKVMVFLRTPIGEKHRLTLRGALPPAGPVADKKPKASAREDAATPLSLGGEVALPLVRLLGARADERFVRIARLPEVLAGIEGATQFKNLGVETAEAGVVGARVIDVLQVSGSAPAAKLKVSPNPQTAAAQLVSTYLPEGKSWQYELRIAVDVQNGLLDELTLELPPQIATPLALSPSMPYEVVAGTGNAMRRLVLRPRQAIVGKFEVLIQAGLTEARRDEPLPVARLLRVPSVVHLLRLPRHSGLTPIRWETSQLAPTRSGKVASKGTAEDEWDTYRIVGPDPQAVLRSARGGGRPYVRLAEHRLLPGSDGALVGLSSFLMEPASTSAGVLLLPADAELLLVTAAGAVVNAEPAAAGVWTVPFASEQMPHGIDVLYRLPARGYGSGDSHTEAFAVPRWEGVRTERSLAAVLSQRSGPRHLPTDGNLVGALRSRQIRLTALDAVLADLAGDGSRAAAEWAAPLVQDRLETVRDLRLDATLLGDAEEGRVLRELLAASDVQSAAAKLPAATLAPPAAVDLAMLWRSGPADACDAVYLAADEELAELRLRIAPREAHPDWRLYYLPAACVLLTLACWAFARIDGLLRWPQLVAVVVGTAWLLLLRPTIVGWVILAAVVGCRLHPSLRHVRERLLNVSPKLSALRKS